MTLLKPQFPPPPFRARPVSIYALSPAQLAALMDLDTLKREAEAEVERLIAFLDMVDGYTLSELDEAVDDVPCDSDEMEPSLGSVCAYDSTSQDGGNWSAGGLCDLEDEHDGREPSLCGKTADCSIMDDRDLEADLGSFDRMIDQRKSMLLADLKYNTFGGWPVAHAEFDDVSPVSA